MKTVFITGANKGIGFETAKQLAALGYYVYIGSRDKANGIEAVEKLKADGLTSLDSIEIDISNTDSIKAARKELESKTNQLDVLVNNAGIAGEQPQTMLTLDIQNLKNIYNTNFFGVIETTQQFIELLKKADEPRILNISSGLGSLTGRSQSKNPNAALYDVYGSSKTALNYFTIALASELKDTKVKVTSIAPGYTATDLNNFQGSKTVEEAAKIVVKYLQFGADSSTGKYFDKEGELAW